MKTLKAIWAIERAKSFGPAADITPGDVFDAEDTEAARLLLAGAVDEAGVADIAVAEATGRRFLIVDVAEVKATKAPKATKTPDASRAPEGQNPSDSALV